MKYLLNLLFLLTTASLSGQYVLSGTISSSDRTKLVGGSVYIVDSQMAAVTEDDGSYYIDDIPAGTYTVQYSYLGYDDYIVDLEIMDDLQYNVQLIGAFYDMDEIQISDNRVDDTSPFTYSEMSHEELMDKNTGVDIPILLNGLTNVQTTSDAGHGIGYTSMRIRGSDQSRINVTINGVPLNDAESQSVFWVDLPDFASSVENIQVQRGVGTSTNGPGAFGGTVGLNTHQLNGDAYVESSGTIGSFGTNKFNVKLGTGILNDRFSVGGRYSLVNSDGYIDRSNAKLNSWMLSPAIYWDDAVLRLDVFSGREVTNQAWFGVPEARLGDDQAALDEHFNNNFFPGGLYQTVEDSLNYYNSDRRYNYYLYENQIDDYQQDHVQLHYYKTFNDAVTSRITGFFTHGAGFFEEYRINDDLDFYDIVFTIDEDTLVTNDIIRRRALENNLFGFFTNNTINPIGSKFGFDIGGGLSHYKGEHFGYVTEIVDVATSNVVLKYYTNDGTKVDYNVYGKSKYQINDHWSTLADLQVRGVNYTVVGDDNKIKGIDIERDWLFFNPKAGITYQKDSLKVYASAAVGNREPDRNDILNPLESNTPAPTHETLYNGELGAQKVFGAFGIKANAYYMYYQNQLVLTGELNDVGANLRANVDESYRAGIELEVDANISSRVRLGGNVAFSKNKITSFDEIVYNYKATETEVIVNNFEDVDIAFSPSVIAGGEITGQIIKPLTVSLGGKYVGQQYLDNTQNEDRALPSYFTANAALRYNPQINGLKNLNVGFHVYNLFSTLFSANGYTYSYGVEDFFITENFYYPQATRHYMLTATIRI